MTILGCIGKGFSTAGSSVSLILTVFTFSFVWALINLPFVAADGAAEPNWITAVLGVVFVLLSIFVQGGSIGYVERVCKQGRSGLDTFFEAGRRNYLRMLGLGVIVGLMMVILAVVAVVGFLAGGPQAEPNPVALVVAGVVAILGLLLLLFLFLAPYAVVVDGKGIFGALKASISFVRANFLKVLVIGVVLVVIGFAIGLLIGLLAGLITGAVPGKFGQAISGFLSSAANSYLGVVTTGAFMALYLSKGPVSSSDAAVPSSN